MYFFLDSASPIKSGVIKMPGFSKTKQNKKKESDFRFYPREFGHFFVAVALLPVQCCIKYIATSSAGMSELLMRTAVTL